MAQSALEVSPTAEETVTDARSLASELLSLKWRMEADKKREEELKRELLAVLKSQGAEDLPVVEGRVAIRRRTTWSKITPSILRKELGTLEAQVFVREVVDEDRLAKEVGPAVFERLRTVEKVTEYLDASPSKMHFIMEKWAREDRESDSG